MTRSGLERIVAALVLLWYACVTGAPASFHACPVHDGDRGAGADATHAAHSHEAPGPGDHDACTCLGDCSAGGIAPAVPAARTTPPPAVAHTKVLAPLPQPESPALTAPAFLRPYANGPPGAGRVA
jgi:hypothetical protein